MKNTKKVALLVTLTLLFTLFISSIAYGDEPSNWAVSEIEKAKKNNLTTERILNNFQSDITREEFCELVVKLYEAISGVKAKPVSPNPFTDTNNLEVLKANNLGIVGGKQKGIFAPNDPITRQEITVMILRTLKTINPSMHIDTEGVKPFADQDKIASWAIEAVKFTNKAGIMSGVGENRVNPLGNTTREQAIIFVQRTYDKYSNLHIVNNNTNSQVISYDEYVNYLYENASNFSINNYEHTFGFEFINITEGEDGYLYLEYFINTDELSKLIDALEAGYENNIHGLYYNGIVSVLQEYYNKDAIAYIHYYDTDLTSYPTGFDNSSLYSGETVKYDESTKTWSVFYPILEITSDLNDENYYYTWDLTF